MKPRNSKCYCVEEERHADGLSTRLSSAPGELVKGTVVSE